MVEILFAILCWALWHLAPHNISMLAFEKDAILQGEWWRLWTAYDTHFNYSQLVISSVAMAVMGFITGTGINPQYRGPYDKKPARPNQFRKIR